MVPKETAEREMIFRVVVLESGGLKASENRRPGWAYREAADGQDAVGVQKRRTVCRDRCTGKLEDGGDVGTGGSERRDTERERREKIRRTAGQEKESWAPEGETKQPCRVGERPFPEVGHEPCLPVLSHVKPPRASRPLSSQHQGGRAAGALRTALSAAHDMTCGAAQQWTACWEGELTEHKAAAVSGQTVQSWLAPSG